MNNIVSKEKFCEIIKQIEDNKKLVDEVNSIFRKHYDNITNDFCNASAMSINFEQAVVDLLQTMFCDVNCDIEYFIYELDFGIKWTKKSLIVDEMSIDISTREKLYDYLIFNYKLKKTYEESNKNAI